MEQPCSGCGATLKPGDVLYSVDAQPECAGCHGQADLLATDRRAAENIRNAGFTSLGCGLLAIVAPVVGLVPFGFAVTVAMVSGIYVLKSLGADNERFTRHLTPRQLTTAQLCAGAGMAIAVVVGLIVLGHMDRP